MVLPVPFPQHRDGTRTPHTLAGSSFSCLDGSPPSGCELVSPGGFHPCFPDTWDAGLPSTHLLAIYRTSLGSLSL